MKRKKTTYNLPKKANGGFTDWLTNNAGGVTQGLGIAGSIAGAMNGADGSPSMGGSAVSGALAGAGMGTSIMPGIGTAVGAVGGAVMGLIQGDKAKQQANAEKKAAELAKKQQRSAFSQSVLNNYATEGVTGTNYYAKGGNVAPTFEAERDEVIQGNNIALEEGKSLASDVALIGGDTHANGGTLGAGGERIFSDQLNSYSGKSFAKIAEKLGKDKGKYEKKIDSKHTATKNTGERMVENIEASLDNLFIEQESMKLQTQQQGAFAKMALGGTPPQTKAEILAAQKRYGFRGKQLDGLWGPQTSTAWQQEQLGFTGSAIDGKFGQQTAQAGLKALVQDQYLDNKNNPNFVIPDGIETGFTAPPPPVVFGGKRTVAPTPGMGLGERFAGIAGKIGQGVSAMAPFMDNIANGMLRTSNVQQPLLNNPIALNKDLNINPELAAMDSQARAANLAIDANTSNSAVGRANKMSVFARTLEGRNELMGKKANYRGQQENTEVMANADIQGRNNQTMNAFADMAMMREDSVNQRTSQNMANLSQDLQGMSRDKKLDAMDLEKFKMAVTKNSDVLDNVVANSYVLSQLPLEFLEEQLPSVKGAANIREYKALIEKKRKEKR